MVNEKSGKDAATLAGQILGGKKATQADAKKLAGSVLTQAPNKKK